MSSGFHGKRLALSCWNPDVEVARIGRDALHRAGLASVTPADHPDLRPVVVHHLGNVARGNVLITRLGHLEPGRKIRPELESVHASARIALWHFLVEDAAAR